MPTTHDKVREQRVGDKKIDTANYNVMVNAANVNGKLMFDPKYFNVRQTEAGTEITANLRRNRWFEGVSTVTATINSTSAAAPTKIVWDETRADVSLNGTQIDRSPTLFSLNVAEDVITINKPNAWYMAMFTLNLTSNLSDEDVLVTAQMYYDEATPTAWHGFNAKDTAVLFQWDIVTVPATIDLQNQNGQLTLFQPFFAASTGNRNEFFVGSFQDALPGGSVDNAHAHLMIYEIDPLYQ